MLGLTKTAFAQRLPRSHLLLLPSPRPHTKRWVFPRLLKATGLAGDLLGLELAIEGFEDPVLEDVAVARL
jgi:hypothetical protein